MYLIWCACMLTPSATGSILGPASEGGGLHNTRHSLRIEERAVRNFAAENKDCWHQLLPAAAANDLVPGNAIHMHTYNAQPGRCANPSVTPRNQGR